MSYLVWRNRKCFENEEFDKQKFSEEFNKHLPSLIKFITLTFLNNKSSANTIYNIVFKMNVELKKGQEFSTKKALVSDGVFFENTTKFDTRKVKYLLFLYAHIYSDFNEDINPNNKELQVEHILPKQWQNANFNGWEEQSHQEYLEKIGNKILLDKKSNIKCSDDFFAKKTSDLQNHKFQRSQRAWLQG